MKLQFRGIKFPFTTNSRFNTYTDLNVDNNDSVKSQIMHLIYTPKGQRLRKPNFGTNLIQYIFSPNDNQTQESIIEDIRESVSSNIPGCNLEDIIMEQSEDGSGLNITIKYSTTSNGLEVTDEVQLSI